jgi:multisubunit Na+/H+ antiporter MnhB subunit
MRGWAKAGAGLFLVLVIGILFLGTGGIPQVQAVENTLSFNTALWEYRGFDIIGQVMLILAGSFAVVVLLREEDPHE